MCGGPVVTEERKLRIEELLRQELGSVYVHIEDHSERHAGHEGARSGAGHYHIVVAAERFRCLNRLAAQRLVYGALAPMMDSDIHALSMRTLTPEQWETR